MNAIHLDDFLTVIPNNIVEPIVVRISTAINFHCINPTPKSIRNVFVSSEEVECLHNHVNTSILNDIRIVTLSPTEYINAKLTIIASHDFSKLTNVSIVNRDTVTEETTSINTANIVIQSTSCISSTHTSTIEATRVVLNVSELASFLYITLNSVARTIVIRLPSIFLMLDITRIRRLSRLRVNRLSLSRKLIYIVVLIGSTALAASVKSITLRTSSRCYNLLSIAVTSSFSFLIGIAVTTITRMNSIATLFASRSNNSILICMLVLRSRLDCFGSLRKFINKIVLVAIAAAITHIQSKAFRFRCRSGYFFAVIVGMFRLLFRLGIGGLFGGRFRLFLRLALNIGRACRALVTSRLGLVRLGRGIACISHGATAFAFAGCR